MRRSDALREEYRRDRAGCAAPDLSEMERLSSARHLYHLSASSLVPRPSSLPAGSRRQSGFSLPLAVFIIVIMALIGTAMVSLSQTGQRSVASEVQSIRTFYAAETGAQTAVAQLLPLDGSNPGCTAALSIFDPPSPKSTCAVTEEDASMTISTPELSGCTIDLCCAALTLAGDDYYRITSDADCSFAGNDTRRRIEVMVRHPDS
ncbi:MAG: hypothetical protein SV201_00345 [Pseudomonadota bacterium]|nr:hypothetical protein [Pseudomonadota bacterium]